MKSSKKSQVRRRRVFYIPGYDPFHARRYRELYRKESAAQAAISGYEIALSPGPAGATRFGWHVDAGIDGQKIESDFEVLFWSDIVKTSMNPGVFATYGLMARTAWTYIVSGALVQLMKMRKGPVIAALYPVFMLIIQLLAALMLAWLGARLAAAAHPVLAVPVALGIIWAMLQWFRKIDNRLFVYYLMHDYAHSARYRGKYPAELDLRLAEFRAEISGALRSDVDEVLVVGHSSGAHLGVSILADLLRDDAAPGDGPVLSFLTLGQVVPMISFLPDATRLRRDLRYLSRQDRLSWVDVTAPGDGCAFALCDPVSVSGVAPDDKRWPLVFSAAFTQSLSPERWKALRWRFFRLHFQYLCAFDRPRDYDYFQITAGPLTLGTRYAGRPASASRIETACSPYRSVDDEAA